MTKTPSNNGFGESLVSRAPKPVFVWLLSIFPILHVYSRNVGTVTDLPVLWICLITLAATSLLFLLFYWLTKSSGRAAVIITTMLVLFFSYGHLAILLDAYGYQEWTGTMLYSLCALALLICVMAWRCPAITTRGEFSKVLNIASVALLIMPLYTIGKFHGSRLLAKDNYPQTQNVRPQRARKIKDSPENPDIYFICPDAYSSNSRLLDQFGYDNSAFAERLEKLGFHVAYDSKSSYPCTIFSLPSVLNSGYIHVDSDGDHIRDVAYLRKLTVDSDVARFLVNRGYSYTVLMSGILKTSSFADENIDFTYGGPRVVHGTYFKEPFLRFFLKTTLLRLAERYDPWIHGGHFRYNEHVPGRFFDTLEEIKKVPENPNATFTLIHLFEPHGPVQLDRDGNRFEATDSPTLQQYLDELEFVNEQFLEMLETIIEKSEHPPIIFFQADHGTRFKFRKQKSKTEPFEKYLQEKLFYDLEGATFEIFNAVYFPQGKPESIDENLHPINTMGLTLKEYFDYDFQSVEVKHFDVPDYSDYRIQIDVTEEVKNGTYR